MIFLFISAQARVYHHRPFEKKKQQNNLTMMLNQFHNQHKQIMRRYHCIRPVSYLVFNLVLFNLVFNLALFNLEFKLVCTLMYQVHRLYRGHIFTQMILIIGKIVRMQSNSFTDNNLLLFF